MWTYLVQNSSCATSVCSILHQKGSLSGLWCTLSGGGAGAESTDPRSENYLGPTDQTRPLVRRHPPRSILCVQQHQLRQTEDSELRVKNQLSGFGLVGLALRNWVWYAVSNSACVGTNYLGVACVVTHRRGGGRHHIVVTLTWWMLQLGEEADIEVSVLIFL